MNAIQKILSRWKAPIALSAIMLVSYGLMLPSLGYSFDDWNFLYYATRGIEGFIEIFHYDGHPQAIWSYIITTKLLGFVPLRWHLLSLFLRIFAVICFWLVLQQVWSENQRENFLASALFALHPIYNLQVFSITFYEIWIGYIFIFLSFLFTIKAVQFKEKSTLFIALAILFRLAAVFTKEYAWFVELIRPMLIWFALPQAGKIQKKAISTAKNWSPHLFIFLASVFWRGFLYTPTRKTFVVDEGLVSSPLNTLLEWAANIIADITYVLISVWEYVIRPEFVYFKRPFNIAIFIGGIIFSIAIFAYLDRTKSNAGVSYPAWSVTALWVGLPSLLFGVVPFYIAQYTIYGTEFPFNARFAIGMLPGIALITAAFIEYWVTDAKRKLVAISLLISLLMVWHIRYTNDFRKVWDYQESLLEQITWRIPGLEENTAIFIYAPNNPDVDDQSPAILAQLVDFPTARAINIIYEKTPEAQGTRLSFWTYLSLKHLENLPENSPLEAGHATSYFKGNTENAIVLLYTPEEGQCLHLIKAGDEMYNRYPDEIKALAPHLSSDAISLERGMQTGIKDQLLGDNTDNWCYYYQIAELAKENQDWDRITTIWNDATQKSQQPKHGTEHIPFIEAFAHAANWQKALELTQMSTKASHAMPSILCPVWQNIETEISQTNEKNTAVQKAYNILDCPSQ